MNDIELRCVEMGCETYNGEGIKDMGEASIIIAELIKEILEEEGMEFIIKQKGKVVEHKINLSVSIELQ